jgi:hypothetical protein
MILGYLLHGSIPRSPPLASSRAGAAPALALAGSDSSRGDLYTSAPLRELTIAAETPDTSPVASPAKERRAVAASRTMAPSTAATTMLLERARSAFRLGNVRAALAFLAQHERRAPRGLAAEDRQRLLRELCEGPEAREASECSGAKAGPELE